MTCEHHRYRRVSYNPTFEDDISHKVLETLNPLFPTQVTPPTTPINVCYNLELHNVITS